MHCQLKVKPPQGINNKTMKAIQIQFETTLFGVKFSQGLFLTDNDVANILKGKPDIYQGYYTRISKVTELHAKKLIRLARMNDIEYCFKVYDI